MEEEAGQPSGPGGGAAPSGSGWPSTTSAPATPWLSRLRYFPLDRLKIDRAFVAEESGEGWRRGAIVMAMIAMAHALGCGVVAEGWEFPPAGLPDPEPLRPWARATCSPGPSTRRAWPAPGVPGPGASGPGGHCGCSWRRSPGRSHSPRRLAHTVTPDRDSGLDGSRQKRRSPGGPDNRPGVGVGMRAWSTCRPRPPCPLGGAFRLPCGDGCRPASRCRSGPSFISAGLIYLGRDTGRQISGAGESTSRRSSTPACPSIPHGRNGLPPVPTPGRATPSSPGRDGRPMSPGWPVAVATGPFRSAASSCSSTGSSAGP